MLKFPNVFNSVKDMRCGNQQKFDADRSITIANAGELQKEEKSSLHQGHTRESNVCLLTYIEERHGHCAWPLHYALQHIQAYAHT